jgi:hypothetical protein
MKGGRRLGAGRPGLHATTAGQHQLDVRRLHQDGYLRTHHRITWGWEGGATISLATSPEAITLIYRYQDSKGEWRNVDQRVNIVHTYCHYGGRRQWFECPYCQRRAAIIYLWNVPVCRKCAELVYSSQSEDVTGRSWIRSRKIEQKFTGGKGGPKFGKPKGMHLETYDRLMQTYRREEEFRDAVLVALFCRQYPHLLG